MKFLKNYLFISEESLIFILLTVQSFKSVVSTGDQLVFAHIVRTISNSNEIRLF